MNAATVTRSINTALAAAGIPAGVTTTIQPTGAYAGFYRTTIHVRGGIEAGRPSPAKRARHLLAGIAGDLAWGAENLDGSQWIYLTTIGEYVGATRDQLHEVAIAHLPQDEAYTYRRAVDAEQRVRDGEIVWSGRWDGASRAVNELRMPCGCTWTRDGAARLSPCTDCRRAALNAEAARLGRTW